MVDTKQLTFFKKTIQAYYQKNKRNLPWRNTRDSYKIVVSEIMLQQTQVSRVLIKYKEFLKAFPNFHSLAKADLKQVLHVWQGMGYNRRALYLRKIAQIIVNRFHGYLPKDPKVLESFPGIGKATAGSIVAFAYDKSTVFIETNIRRVFIHFFFKDKKEIHDRDILVLVEDTMDKENPRDWYYALMDYGSMLAKKVENPNKKSAHYHKQSVFEGSVRQIRGGVLRHALQYGFIEESAFPKLILEEMEKEGFIKEKKGRYYITK